VLRKGTSPVQRALPRSRGTSSPGGWSDDYLHIIGITATGRATVEALQLNRTNLVNLRRALYSIGAHPPAYQQE
jgi:hypothetical protein